MEHILTQGTKLELRQAQAVQGTEVLGPEWTFGFILTVMGSHWGRPLKTKLTRSDSCFGKLTLALCRGDCEGDEWNWGYESCIVQARFDGTSISISTQISTEWVS